MNHERAEELLKKINGGEIKQSKPKTIEEFWEKELEKKLALKTQQSTNMERSLAAGKIILKSTELGYSYDINYAYANQNNTLKMFKGKCHRQLFFDWINMSPSEPIDLCASQIIQNTEFLKNNFFETLPKENVITGKQEFTLKAKDFEIEGYIDGVIKNPVNDKTTLVFFETLKSGFFVFDNPNTEGKPMNIHLLKIIPALIHFNMPAILIYQDKSNMKMRSFDIHMKDYVLYVKNVPFEDFKLDHIITNIMDIWHELNSKKTPNRSYEEYQQDQCFALASNNIITTIEERELRTGKPVYPFECRICKYFTLCKNTPNMR